MAKQTAKRSYTEAIGKALNRALTLVREDLKIDTEARTVEMSFSSDQPIEHWFGRLILNHAPAAIRLNRLRDGGPLLLDHDRTKQIGVHERVETDGHKLRGTVRFSRGSLGEEIFQDVNDAIRRNASIGLIVHELHLVREDDDGPVYQSDDWEPLENSIVSIPADTSVGVGRAMDDEDDEAKCSECGGEGCDTCKDEEEQSTDSADGERAANNPNPEVRTAMDPNTQTRETELVAIGAIYGEEELARDFALENKTDAELRTAIREKRKAAQAKTPAETPGSVASRQGGPVVTMSRSAIGGLKAFRGANAREQAHRFGMFMLAGPMARHAGPGVVKRAVDFCKENGIAVSREMQLDRTQSEGDNESGGFLVPVEFENAMIDLREKYGVFRRFANVVPMASDQKQRPRRKGGLTAYPMGAKGSSRRMTESQKSWDVVELFARKWAVLAKYEEELNEDSVISMADDLANEIAYAFTLTEDQCGFLGDGTSDYHGIVGVIPKIQSLDATVANVAGIVVASGNAWSEIVRGDLTKLVGRLPEYAESPNTRFFCSKTFWAEVLVRLTLEAGGATAAEIEGARHKTFMGYPVEVAQVLPRVESNSSIPLLFGDMAKSSMFGDRRGITIKLTDSNDTDFEEDLISIKGTERFDINNHDLGNASATASLREPGPLVALQMAAA